MHEFENDARESREAARKHVEEFVRKYADTLSIYIIDGKMRQYTETASNSNGEFVDFDIDRLVNHLVAYKPKSGPAREFTRLFSAHSAKLRLYEQIRTRVDKYGDYRGYYKVPGPLASAVEEAPTPGGTDWRMFTPGLHRTLSYQGTCSTANILVRERPPVAVPAKPTKAERKAASALLDQLLEPFNFCEADDRACALMLMFTMLTRRTFPLAPCWIITGPGPGIGKTSLARLAQCVAHMRVDPLITGGGPGTHQDQYAPANDMQLCQHTFLLDNVDGVFNGFPGFTPEKLSSIITSREEYTIRPAKSAGFKADPNTLWVITGTNTVLAPEDKSMKRRTVDIRLKTATPPPDFSHIDKVLSDPTVALPYHVALCTLVNFAVNAGVQPKLTGLHPKLPQYVNDSIHGFDDWKNTVGMLLAAL